MVGVDVGAGLLVAGALLFDDELHAAAINASAMPAISIDRTRCMVDPQSPVPASEHTLRPMTNPREVETAERTIPHPPEAIFAFLADPRRHHDIDGSGSVGSVTTGPERVKLADQFTVNMKLGVVPYKMVSTIIEFEENRRIAWQTCSPGRGGRFTGGRIWRYELEPVEGGTRVRESWDFSQEKMTKPIMHLGAVRKHNRESMESTLANIEKLLASG